MLVVTSRDPGAPPVDYIKRSGGIFKDMLIHDFDIFRWILDDEAATVYATGSCLTDPAIEAAGDVDATAVTIRTRSGRLAQINTIRRAAYGYDQRFEVLGSKGMLQAGNHRPTEVVAWSATVVAADKPEHFFLERYRAAYAAEMAHFFDASRRARRSRTTIDDGVKALALAEAATTFVAREAHRRAMRPKVAMTRTDCASASPGSAGWARGMRRISRIACPGAELVAACDPIADELGWAPRQLGVAQRYADYAELLAQPRSRRGVPGDADDAARAADRRRAACAQACVLRKAAVARRRRVPARRGGSRAAAGPQGDDRLRSPLRPELPACARADRGRAPSAGR